MKVGEALTLLTFCAGAVFTLVDIGIDTSLVFEYANNRYVSTANLRLPIYLEHTWDRAYLATSGYQWNFHALRTDTLGRFSFLYMILTASWIVLGGLFQTATIIYILIKKDPRVSTCQCVFWSAAQPLFSWRRQSQTSTAHIL